MWKTPGGKKLIIGGLILGAALAMVVDGWRTMSAHDAAAPSLEVVE